MRKHATRISIVSPARLLAASSLALMAASLIPATARAADADAADATTAQTGVDIVVTARGRTESLLKVPDTITVFNRDDMPALRLETIDDVIAVTPGVFIINDQDPGTNLISIRGVSTNRNQAPSIAYIVDGLALADPELFTLRTYDLARIEVLKGPQGALFGRSASGGIINITTADPGPQAGGEASLGLGNGLTVNADAAFNLPLSDKVQLRLAGSLRDTEGFITNTFLRRKVDGFVTRNLRAKLRAELDEATVLKLRLGWANEDGGAAFISSGNVTGQFGGRLAGAALTEPFGDFEGRASREWWGVQATLEHETTGGLRISWTAGLDDYAKQFVEELDFRNGPVSVFGQDYPDGLAPISQPVGIRAYTTELRLTSPDDQRLRWLAGVFAQRLERDRTDDFGPLLGGFEPQRWETRSNQIGLFGQVSYDVAPTFEATMALRYDRDSRAERNVGAVSGTPFGQRARVFEKWQPKISLAWRPSSDFTAYVTGAIGFKAGGFNPAPFPPVAYDEQFAAETTRSIEAGIKTALADGRVRLSLAGFLTDFRNFQNTVFFGNSIVFSVPRVNVRGLEAALEADLGAGFRLQSGAAYTRSRVGRYLVPNPTPEPGEPDILDLTGNRTPNAPDWTVNGALAWRGEAGKATIDARFGVNWVSRVDFEIDNILHTPGYASVDTRLAATVGRLTLDVWARNLFDKRWAISAFGQQQLPLLLLMQPGGPFDSFTINPGRQFGTSATIRF